MIRTAAVFRNRLLAALLPVALAGCASVDLGRHYQPPPILTPQTVSAPAQASAPAAGALPAAQSQPVASEQTQSQPLPPMDGASAAPPESGASSAPSAQTRPDDPNANLVTFTTRMSGASAVPPADSGGTGQLDALYDTSTGLLRWKASWSGLSGPITAVQFHGPADASHTAPPTMIWPAPFGPTYEGRAVLTPRQAGDLLAGRWYVNVYTDTYPTGELRGQLRQVP